MESSFFPFVVGLVLIFFCQSLSFVHASVVESTCKTVADESALRVDYNFCVTSLQTDLRSVTADTPMLALIATNLSLANATSAKSKISNSLNETDDPFTKDILNTCSTFYTEMISGLTSSIDAIKHAHYLEANKKIVDIENNPQDCEELFVETGRSPSPLAKENDDTSGLSIIADLITSSLK